MRDDDKVAMKIDVVDGKLVIITEVKKYQELINPDNDFCHKIVRMIESELVDRIAKDIGNQIYQQIYDKMNVDAIAKACTIEIVRSMAERKDGRY